MTYSTLEFFALIVYLLFASCMAMTLVCVDDSTSQPAPSSILFLMLVFRRIAYHYYDID